MTITKHERASVLDPCRKLASVARNYGAAREARRAGDYGAGRNRDASHRWGYSLLTQAIRALVALEDRYGVESCGKLADRVATVQRRAVDAGLLSMLDVVTIERDACASVAHPVERMTPPGMQALPSDWTRSTQTVEGVRVQVDLRAGEPRLYVFQDRASGSDVERVSDHSWVSAVALEYLRDVSGQLDGMTATVRINDAVRRGPRDTADLVARALRFHLAGVGVSTR